MALQRFATGFLSETRNKVRKKGGPDQSGTIDIPVEMIPSLIEYLYAAEKHDGYRGSVVVKLQVAGWEKTSNNGTRFMSLSVSENWKMPADGYRPKPKSSVPVGSYKGPGMARGPEDENDGFDEPPF